MGDIELVRSGSPYAVTPGRVRKQDGTPFRVFTPFRTAWLEHGWRRPADTSASTLDWITPRTTTEPATVPTSRLSAFPRFGVLHPRTLLQDCDGTFRSELAWREFYADVLWHRPETARENYDRRFDRMKHDDDRELFEAWKNGRTGYPIVGAGMRQLLREGFLHNRVRGPTSGCSTR